MNKHQIENTIRNEEESFDTILPLAEEVTARMRVICHKLEMMKRTITDSNVTYEPLTQNSSKNTFNVGEKISAMP